MLKHILMLFLLASSFLYAAIEETPSSTLTIDTLKQGTTSTGSVNLQIVVKLRPGDKVQFILSSGETFLCLVKEFTIIENEERIKIFGDILSPKAGGFGFTFTKKGHIAGAILIHNTKDIYTLQSSNEDGKFYFIKDIAPVNII